MEEESVPCYHLTENPENNIVAAPDGRVFSNMEPVLVAMSSRLIKVALQAELTQDDNLRHQCVGAMAVLKELSETQDAIIMVVEKEKLDREKGLDKDPDA